MLPAKDLGVAVRISPIPCVIITDNYAFDRDAAVMPETAANSRSAPALVRRMPRCEGLDEAELVQRDRGIVAAFEELARWKTTRGGPTRVVTVSEILAGVVSRESGGLTPRTYPS